MIRRPARSTRTDTLLPYSTRFRSELGSAGSLEAVVSRSELRLEQDRFLVSPVDLRVYQYDGELLHRSSWADGRVRSAVGGSWRLSRSEEHTSELQSLMRISYAVFCLKKKITQHTHIDDQQTH